MKDREMLNGKESSFVADELSNIIYSMLNEIGVMNNLQVPEEMDFETKIVGVQGILDSLAFVSFLVAVEQKINEKFDKHISLNSERAFAQKQNPFRSVGTLRQYITDNWDDDN